MSRVPDKGNSGVTGRWMEKPVIDKAFVGHVLCHAQSLFGDNRGQGASTRNLKQLRSIIFNGNTLNAGKNVCGDHLGHPRACRVKSNFESKVQIVDHAVGARRLLKTEGAPSFLTPGQFGGVEIGV